MILIDPFYHGSLPIGFRTGAAGFRQADGQFQRQGVMIDD